MVPRTGSVKDQKSESVTLKTFWLCIQARELFAPDLISKTILNCLSFTQNQFRFDGHTRVHLAAHEVVRVESLGSYDRDPTNFKQEKTLKLCKLNFDCKLFELSCKNLLELSFSL